MNQCVGNVKCKKSEQPKNNQNRSDYRKHIFISLPLNPRRSALSFLPLRRGVVACMALLSGHKANHGGAGILSCIAHMRLVISLATVGNSQERKNAACRKIVRERGVGGENFRLELNGSAALLIDALGGINIKFARGHRVAHAIGGDVHDLILGPREGHGLNRLAGTQHQCECTHVRL